MSKATPKIQVTKNYDLFILDLKNRELKPAARRKLLASMKTYGFIPSFPCIVQKDEKGRNHLKDGQHRFHFAKQLGLPIYWVEDTTGFDVPTVNSTQKTWGPIDYAESFANDGSASYKELLQFHKDHKIPITTAAMLLSGTVAFVNIADKFYGGDFKVKDRSWAATVVAIYAPIKSLDKHLKSNYLLAACSRVARVPGFSTKRFAENLNRCRDMLSHYGSTDAFIEMIEKIYNFGRRDLMPIKIECVKAMRERNPATRGKTATA